MNNSTDSSYKTGKCTICGATRFVYSEKWKNYRCTECNSAPRQRRIHYILNKYIKDWDNIRVMEFAPINNWIMKKAKNYVATQYYPDKKLGDKVGRFENQNIENLTCENGSYDLFLVEDIFEHIFDPQKAISELMRSLSKNGYIIGTVPLENKHRNKKTQKVAIIDENSKISYIKEPRYHGNPIPTSGSLVVWEYGDDFEDILTEWVNKDGKIKFFSGPMDKYCIDRDNRSTFLIQKNVKVSSVGQSASLTQMRSQVRALFRPF